MMARTKNMPANKQTVKRVLDLALATPSRRLAPKLRQFARERLDAGYPNDQLYTDFMSAYEVVSERDDEEREDALLDVMDFLTGWCAPDARLY
jgi:hypothetical protein